MTIVLSPHLESVYTVKGIVGSNPTLSAKRAVDWLKSCEGIFGFNLEGYGKMRMYTFLAERYLPFWFKKYTNYLEWPVIYYDINK